MGKFFLGLLTGIVVVIVAFFCLVYFALRMQSKPPTVANNSVLVLRVSGDLPEKPPLDLPSLLGGDDSSVTMPGAWMALKKAALDSRIKAVVLAPESISAGWAKIEELRSDIETFRKSGKPVFAYLRSPAARDYYVALAADRIYLGPQEPLMLKGLRSEVMYFKGTLDKLGAAVEIELLAEV
jgi:protease-4